MSPAIATLVVAAFFLVSAETYLATHARGIFKMAFAGVGPTELRILIAAGAVALIHTPTVNLFGMGSALLWDVGGLIGAIGMVATFVVSSAQNVRALYLEESRR
jgi:archaetidylinositol phosphate synthase